MNLAAYKALDLMIFTYGEPSSIDLWPSGYSTYRWTRNASTWAYMTVFSRPLGTSSAYEIGFHNTSVVFYDQNGKTIRTLRK
jgi:hypothetical protein